MSNKENIVLTGGHAGTTAIALVEELKENTHVSDKYNLYWIGAKSSVEGAKTSPIETKVLPKIGVAIVGITAGRLQRKFTFWTIPSLLKIPFGFINAFRVLIKVKPKIIISFGGYVAVPVVIVGKLLGAKVIIHEQTLAAGRANIFTSKFANKIAVARKESSLFFNKEKIVITGNPLMKSILNTKVKSELSKIPTIFITLGSRGSQRVNLLINEILPEILKQYKVIHLTGQFDYEKFLLRKNELNKELSSNYEIYSVINPLDIHKYYARADMLIGRAGANTVSELIYLKIPAILIPIPFSYLNEQYKNAKYASEFGAAKILEEKEMTVERLVTEIKRLTKNFPAIKEKLKVKESPDKTAGKKLADLIIQYL